MKHSTIYLAVGLALAAMFWHRGAKAKDAAAMVNEGVPVDPSNWFGDWWQRYNGGDLTYNGAHPVAQPTIHDILSGPTVTY